MYNVHVNWDVELYILVLNQDKGFCPLNANKIPELLPVHNIGSRPLPVLFGATGGTAPRAPILTTAVWIIHSTPRVKPTNSNLTLLVRLRANGRNNSQQSSANNVGNCCVRVGSGLQTDATTPDKVGTCSASWEGYNPYLFVDHA